MIEQNASLVKALNRFGHHDHDCPSHDVFSRELACTCGFNQVLRAALDGDAIEPIPPSMGRTPKTLRELAARVFDLTNELNAAFAQLQEEVKRRRAAGLSDEHILKQVDAAGDSTPERKAAQKQVERVILPAESGLPGARAPVNPEVAKRAREYATGRRPVR